MEPGHNYKAFKNPRKAIYHQCTNVYGKKGWIQKEVETTVIGEDDHVYVERLKPGSHGEWVGEVVVQREYILAIGFHKSRFVKWVDTQLELFK
jgi:hypothetical protein